MLYRLQHEIPLFVDDFVVSNTRRPSLGEKLPQTAALAILHFVNDLTCVTNRVIIIIIIIIIMSLDPLCGTLSRSVRQETYQEMSERTRTFLRRRTRTSKYKRENLLRLAS